MRTSKEKEQYIRIEENSNIVTFQIPKFPRSTSELGRFLRTVKPYIRVFRLGVSVIAVLTVLALHDAFQQVQFTQEVSGTLVWAFALLGMLTWGFK